MKADNPVADGTYQIRDGNLVDYAAKWSYGYMVGLPGGMQFNSYRITQGGLAKTAAQLGWTLFGVWTDPETGIQYIDPVKHVGAIQDALALARESGELAIWDLRESVAITVEG